MATPLATSLPARAGGLVRFFLAIAAATGCAAANASPRIPASDATVLEHVPAAAASRTLEPLRQRLAADPKDVSSALALARGYLDIGRATADPRFVSYAQAALAPWMASARPSAEVLILNASTLQYLHRFEDALKQLDQALALQPRNAQAWLIKATILQVQGQFDAARQACRRLVQSSGQLIGLTCLTSVNSLTGQLAPSYAALRTVFRDDPGLPTGVRLWILEQLADMAERAGDDRAAEGHLIIALRASPKDGYVKAQYADLLLRERRDAEVIQLLHEDGSQDNLLLRLAIAGTQMHDPAAGRWSDEFQARFEAARRDGDNTHLREQARFVLAVRGRAAEALDLARRNWQVQKEPADVRLYVATAAAASNASAAAEIREWISSTHYEDHTLAVRDLLSGGSARP